MGRGQWYAFMGLALLVAAGLLGWRTWAGMSVGQFDPVGAVLGLAGLTVSVVALGLAVRAQRHAETGVADAAGRLAVAVRGVEVEARRQLLGGHDRSIDVGFGFRPAPAHEAAGAPAGGTLDGVVAYYHRLRPRRMVITGVGGSGKTVLAIELILGLLDDRGPDDPVPVRFSTAAVDTSRPVESALADWLVDHLKQTYRLSETAARQLVAARMVLPVLDGLDEMDAVDEPGYGSRTAQTIRACNAYLDGSGGKGSLVLTCRIEQYEALEKSREWVHDAARIQIHPVALPQARDFLTGRVTDKDRWRPVMAGMRQGRNRPLAQALSTPWRLTLTAAVYERRDPTTGHYLHDPAELIAPGMDSDDKIRDHLIGLLIPTLTDLHHSPYPADQVHRWLATLARYLHDNTSTPARPVRTLGGRTLSGTDLVLHELWPLAGTRLPRAIPALITATAWACSGGYLITHVPIGFSPSEVVVGAVGAVFVALFNTYLVWADHWSPPIRIDPLQIRTRSGQLRLVVGLTAGLTAGVGVGLTAGVRVGVGFGVGIAACFTLAHTVERYSPAGPHEAVRSSTTAGLGVGLAFGLTAGVGVGVAGGLMFGLTFGLAFGLTGYRYLAMLLCVRRWAGQPLPWRLGRFLHWCYGAGLVRIAGIGYQFRHRELQEYLARHPTT
jgi:NACHT domain-containing protein